MKTNLIYIAGPYRGGNDTAWGRERNVMEANDLARGLLSRRFGVVVPHAMYHNIDDEWINAETIMWSCLQVLKRCDAIVFLPGWEESEGSREEWQFARDHGIKMGLAVKDPSQLTGWRLTAMDGGTWYI